MNSINRNIGVCARPVAQPVASPAALVRHPLGASDLITLGVMQPDLDSQTARDRLLRCIGRNVVNFQYLEATLRSMIPALSAKGTLRELQIRQAEVSRKHKKSSLGDLAGAFHERVFRNDMGECGIPDEAPPEPTMDFSIRLEAPPEAVAEQKRALAKLVAERNRLIHKDILSVDLNSPEQCEALAAQLDEQNTRIRQQLAHLNSIRDGLREAAAEFQRFIESEEFLAVLRGEPSTP